MAKRDYVESNGNVFADLGLPNPEEMLAKAELAIKIAEILRQRRLTQVQAAEMLGVDQPKVSALVRGRLSGFSIERLLRFLLLLGADVSIMIKPHQRIHSRSRSRVARHHSKFPNAGILTVVNFVTAKAPKSHKVQQGSAGAR
jgi:predicted XRE-type DNA-binding protein